MVANETPSSRRWQNPGFVVAGTSYNALVIIAGIYIVRALMTFNLDIGNDCSTQQFAHLESFRATRAPAAKYDRLMKKTDESIRATTESETEEDRFMLKKKTSESPLPPLSKITQSLTTQCDEGMIYKTDFIADNVHDNNRWNKIPKIIHQTSKSRCLTLPFNISTSKWSNWNNDGWSYYFHDDDAMQRMFEMNYDVFPLLKDVHENCLISGTAKADLWRYLVLWHYGGVYSDIDTTPNNLNPDTFSSLATEESELEAFFIIEAFHFLSQYFFAIAPKHPLMHHTILSTLHNLLSVDDTVAWDASMITGPKALHQGFVHFLDDVGIKPRNGTRGFGKEFRHKYIITNATIVGTANYTIGAYGISKDSDFWVWRYDKDVSRRSKNGGYAEMGMEHFGKLKKRPSGISCQQAIKDRHHQEVTTKYIRTKKVDG
ncbi:unnamed protein product [Cylindrotheca closterium]|uniref:Uncharacterized protein n=1 Tax=Cylindrotheca closterium TaxID=2856 RepID=A0AAD2G099_9STRA|nr:unnamed protein product [Cylindrotheca closterium]